MYSTVNCFQGALPQNLCSARQVEVLSLNGLGAAEGCKNRVVVPLSGVGLFNTVGGTVPSCVWALRNLSVLHLTGNGLTGELVRWLPVSSQIADLSLSHNQLIGTIPADILNITIWTCLTSIFMASTKTITSSTCRDRISTWKSIGCLVICLYQGWRLCRMAV